MFSKLLSVIRIPYTWMFSVWNENMVLESISDVELVRELRKRRVDISIPIEFVEEVDLWTEIARRNYSTVLLTTKPKGNAASGDMSTQISWSGHLPIAMGLLKYADVKMSGLCFTVSEEGENEEDEEEV